MAIPRNAPRSEARTHTDLPKRVRDEIELFFLAVTVFEGKDAQVLGWGGPQAAWALVKGASIACE